MYSLDKLQGIQTQKPLNHLERHLEKVERTGRQPAETVQTESKENLNEKET